MAKGMKKQSPGAPRSAQRTGSAAAPATESKGKAQNSPVKTEPRAAKAASAERGRKRH